MSTTTYNNLNVSNTLNATDVNCDNLNCDNLIFQNSLETNNLTVNGNINNVVTPENLSSLDTTTSISTQIFNLKEYVDEQISLILNNPDLNVNSITELANILGNDPTLNVVTSLGDKISISAANQNVTATNLTFSNQIFSPDYMIKNVDNTTKSVKTSIANLETNTTSNSNAITTLNTNLANNYYTKTQSDTNYYTKTQSDTNYYTKTAIDDNFFTKTFINQAYYNKIEIDGKIDPINEKLSTNDTALTVNSNNITFLKPIVSSYPISTTSSLSSNSLTTTNNTTGTLTTTRINSTNVNTPLEINLNLGANAVTCVNGRLGINLSNPVAGSVLHAFGGTTLEGSLHVTDPADFDSSLNCQSLTIGAVNVGDTLNNNASLISTNTSNITSLLNTRKKYPRYSIANSSTQQFASQSKYTTPNALQFIFTTKNSAPFMNPVVSQPISFRVTALFYIGLLTSPGCCNFNLMIMPTSFVLESWGTYQGTDYNLNNTINGSSSFNAPNRPYWTFNQDFQTTTGGAGYLWAYTVIDNTTNKRQHFVNVAIMFNNPAVYNISVETLDITGASNYDVDIVM